MADRRSDTVLLTIRRWLLASPVGRLRRRSVGAALAGLSLLGANQVARARVDAQSFHPVADGQGWIAAPSTHTLPPGVFGFGVFLNYAVDPIQTQVGETGPSSEQSSVTTDLWTVDLLVAAGILPGWDVSLDVPLSSIRNVAFAQDLGDFTFGVGDLRIGTKVNLVERGLQGLGLALSGEVTAPTGDTANFLGEEGVTFSLGVVTDASIGPLDAALRVGYLFRDEKEGLGDAATLNAALAWPIRDIDLTPVVEIHGASTFDGFLSHEESSPLEALVGVRWNALSSWFEQMGLASRGITVTAGAGFGLNAGIGSPEVRALIGFAPTVGSPAQSRPKSTATLESAPAGSVGGASTQVQIEPEGDRDQDGIGDDLDVCPGLPETRNGYLDEDGCPDSPPRTTPTAAVGGASPIPTPHPGASQLESFPPLHFDSASGALSSDGVKVLDRLASLMRRERSLRVRLTGHSDASGPQDSNERLAQSRADQARRALLARAGVDASRVEAEGRGTSEPVASNATPEGRARNRRVEIELIRPTD